MGAPSLYISASNCPDKQIKIYFPLLSLKIWDEELTCGLVCPHVTSESYWPLMAPGCPM